MNHPGSHANALHAKFPDKLILIAGDDDQHLEASQGINPGRSKAAEAAKAVGGCSLLGDCLRQAPAARLPRWRDRLRELAGCNDY
jgi:phage/plasmid primase-like uncharacterized protein